jgi:RNA polymerase sigma-70 factor, ECF subfamily
VKSRRGMIALSNGRREHKCSSASGGGLRLPCRVEPSPVVELNRAVAVAMRDGPSAGLELIDAILTRGDLADYHLAYAARAELCRRLGRTADAVKAYEKAIALARQEPEKRFLKERLNNPHA